ncbi:MAG TPA: hypothetical protein VMV54_03990, partial [Acidocella sp.]|nr:hypothetical protein [Acidocella sp.]
MGGQREVGDIAGGAPERVYSENEPFVDFGEKNDCGDFAVMKTLLSLFEDSAALVENPLRAA